MKQSVLNTKNAFAIFFVLLSVLVFFISLLRCYLVPFNHDETATFFFFIQSGNYMPFYSAADANNHVLNSFLGNVCFHVFGSSTLSLRIPNLIGLIILMIATYRISKNLNLLGSKLILTTAFLLSFHWLSFFSACRGYGLSLALLIMGAYFLLELIKSPTNIKKYLLALLFFQLAISANLILIIVVLVLSAIVLMVQFFNKTLIKPIVIIAWLFHFGAIFYWLSYSFFLKDHGALYYGEGDSYWEVTFETLIQLVVGTYSSIIKWIVLIVVSLVAGLFLYTNKTILLKVKQHIKQPDFSILFFIILWSLVIGFYLMHILFGVNFPEDRTSLFFYVFFVLWLCFTIDKLSIAVNKSLGVLLAGLFAIHFMWNLNFRKHSLNVYETIPVHFYETLINEQAKSQDRITIGGHRVRELFYAFLNYRHGSKLNPADPTEVMQMNCDYYIATKQEEKYFQPYYEIIDSEPDWGFVILKRKEKIQKKVVLELKNKLISNNDNEFIDIYGHSDTVFFNNNPLIAEFEFDFEKAPVPINAWLVFQINDSLDQSLYFKRYPLQWITDNLNGKKGLRYSLITGNLPRKAKKIACFLWNIEKKKLSVRFNSFKIYQIEGKGVDYVAPDIK